MTIPRCLVKDFVPPALRVENRTEQSSFGSSLEGRSHRNSNFLPKISLPKAREHQCFRCKQDRARRLSFLLGHGSVKTQSIRPAKRCTHHNVPLLLPSAERPRTGIIIIRARTSRWNRYGAWSRPSAAATNS